MISPHALLSGIAQGFVTMALNITRKTRLHNYEALNTKSDLTDFEFRFLVFENRFLDLEKKFLDRVDAVPSPLLFFVTKFTKNPAPMPRSADFLRKPDVFAVRLHVQRNTPAPTSGLRRTHCWKSFLTSIFGEIAERKKFVEAS